LNVSPDKGVPAFHFFKEDPIYLQSVIIHSANGGKGEGWLVEEYSVALQNESGLKPIYMEMCYRALLFMPLVISHHLLNK
jgi:hypothetical protein